MKNFYIKKAELKDIKDIIRMTNLAHREKKWPCISLYRYDKEKLETLKKQIKEKNSGAYHFIARDKENNKLLGLFSYFYDKKTRTRETIKFTWKIHPQHTRKGIGTELLKYSLKDAKKRGFKKALAEIVTKNKASLKLAIKFNFIVEGLIKKGFTNDNGSREDYYIVGKEL